MKCEIISHFPIVITGSLDGRTVASDKTDCPRKATQIAAGWRDSGLEVTAEEKSTRHDAPESTRRGSFDSWDLGRVEASNAFLLRVT